MTNVLVENCISYEGGGLYFDSSNNDLQISNIRVINCTATFNGGGIYMARSNFRVSMRSVSIVNCVALEILDGGYGGGLYVGFQNNFMTVQNVEIVGCSGQYGGGMLSFSNKDLTISDTTITDCYAAVTGGGIYLLAHNFGVTILRTNISANTAGKDGGGVASQTQTNHLVIVDSVVRDNHADRNGGGIYLHSGNAGFALLDTLTFGGLVIIESEHPYQFVDEILIRTVSVPGAVGYYVFFDEQSEIAESDYCYIEAPLGEAAFESWLDGWPGLTEPPLLLIADSVTLYFGTQAYGQGSTTKKEDNFYGVRLTTLQTRWDP